MKTILLTLLLSIQMFFVSLAQQMPLVYDVENTGADGPKTPLLSFDALPVITSLPDPFMWADGRGRISNFSDWKYRRAEVSAQIQNYEIGTKPAPPSPGNLLASFTQNKLTVTVIEGADTLVLTAAISYPTSGTGPFPAVIGIGSGTGSLPADIFTSRGIATITYNFSEVAPWTQSGRGQGGFYRLYPDSKVGYFAAWAWGISRIIDGLQKIAEANIDTRHLGVTGCSFAGKIALYSGALDERIALTIAQEPGGGGDAAWRVTQTLNGSRETLSNAQSYGWYYQDVSLFNSAVTKLPFDHHEVMGMIAPRALFVLGNPTQEWLADESGHVASMAAIQIWTALGVPDRFGFSKVGGHNHCAMPDVQKPEVVAFVEKFLLGIDTNTEIRTTGYHTDLTKWITWTTPILTNNTSYFGQTTLISPPNLEKDMAKDVNFSWNKANDAEKYYFQISTDPTFKVIALSDSTTDTIKTVTDLLKGKIYYWRVQVKNTTGSLGPWSDLWNFATYIDLPASPQLVSAVPVENRPGYVKLNWNKAIDADQYSIQVSDRANFTAISKSETASDTFKTVSGLSQEKKYYWRVQSKNIAGSSNWSDASYFTILSAPTALTLQQTATNQVTLSWTDNSAVEDGYVIERMVSPQTSFSFLDTSKGSGSTYVDNSIDQDHNFTYRIKAYKEISASDYSNEASLILVGIEDNGGIPKEYSISQNYPNPFNPSTKVKFSLPHSALTRIIIYDLLGREIRTLINTELEAGYHEINIDANNLSSGVYFYRIQSGDFNQTKKMILKK